MLPKSKLAAVFQELIELGTLQKLQYSAKTLIENAKYKD